MMTRGISLAEDRMHVTARDFRDRLTDTIPELVICARSLTNNRADADDLIQDTIEKALKRQSLYTETGSLVGWLKTIMQNLFIDRVRARRRHERIEEVVSDGLKRFCVVKACQEDRRFLSELEWLLSRLSRGDEKLIMAIGVNGESYEEAANCLNLPQGTVRSRLSRSRAMLLKASQMYPSGPDF